MVFTQEEESIIRLGIDLYKKRMELGVKRTERSVYNVDDIKLLETEIETKESKIKTEILKL